MKHHPASRELSSGIKEAIKESLTNPVKTNKPRQVFLFLFAACVLSLSLFCPFFLVLNMPSIAAKKRCSLPVVVQHAVK